MRFFYIILCFVIIASCTLNKGYRKVSDLPDFKISSGQLQRLTNYLNGNYYSYELERNEINTTPGYFAISDDGRSSIIVMCIDHINPYSCNSNLKYMQSVKRIEKKTGKKFYILAEKYNIFVKNNSVTVFDPKSTKLDLYFNVLNDKNNQYFDILLEDIKNNQDD